MCNTATIETKDGPVLVARYTASESRPHRRGCFVVGRDDVPLNRRNQLKALRALYPYDTVRYLKEYGYVAQ